MCDLDDLRHLHKFICATQIEGILDFFGASFWLTNLNADPICTDHVVIGRQALQDFPLESGCKDTWYSSPGTLLNSHCKIQAHYLATLIPVPSSITMYLSIGRFGNCSIRPLGSGHFTSIQSIFARGPIPRTKRGSCDER